jgi:hypothetical protein
MNPFEFVLVVLVMVFAFTLIKHRLGIRDKWNQPAESSQETLRLKEEVSQLKERLKVLERITVEKENSLAQQIDELRDR